MQARSRQTASSRAHRTNYTKKRTNYLMVPIVNLNRSNEWFRCDLYSPFRDHPVRQGPMQRRHRAMNRPLFGLVFVGVRNSVKTQVIK